MILNRLFSNKCYYRFIEFTSKFVGCGMTHEKIKLLCYDQIKAESIEEIEVRRFIDAYLYILNNINQTISYEILERVYYLLTNKINQQGKLEKILSLLYRNNDLSIHHLVSKIHLFILDIIEYKNVEYAFLISNYLMIKKGRFPLIIYPANYERYQLYIKEKNEENLTILFFNIERRIEKKVNKKIISKEDIISLIKKNKEDIITKYKVEKLFLFGSFAKDIVLDDSDIDLVVIFDEELINEEKQIFYKKLLEFLVIKFDREIDLLNFNNALKKFDIGEMENLITLI